MQVQLLRQSASADRRALLLVDVFSAKPHPLACIICCTAIVQMGGVASWHGRLELPYHFLYRDRPHRFCDMGMAVFRRLANTQLQGCASWTRRSQMKTTGCQRINPRLVACSISSSLSHAETLEQPYGQRPGFSHESPAVTVWNYSSLDPTVEPAACS
jgi:hypothetical protein